MTWLQQFYKFTAYMRGRGWRGTFILRGQVFRIPGTAELLLRYPDNDVA